MSLNRWISYTVFTVFTGASAGGRHSGSIRSGRLSGLHGGIPSHWPDRVRRRAPSVGLHSERISRRPGTSQSIKIIYIHTYYHFSRLYMDGVLWMKGPDRFLELSKAFLFVVCRRLTIMWVSLSGTVPANNPHAFTPLPCASTTTSALADGVGAPVAEAAGAAAPAGERRAPTLARGKGARDRGDGWHCDPARAGAGGGAG